MYIDEGKLTASIRKEIERLCLHYQYQVTIGTLAALLLVDVDTAADWLIAKIAAFRGIQEREIAEFIKERINGCL